MIDITAQKEAEQRLRATEDQYRTLVEHSPAVIFTSDVDFESTTLYMSPQIEQMLGYPASYWSSPTFWDEIIHPDDLARVTELDQETTRTLEPYDTEFRIIAADGRLVWVRNY
jgi:PAS domain S-box-containing protein